MAVEIVDFSINSMVIFHSYVNVYQRVAGIAGGFLLFKIHSSFTPHFYPSYWMYKPIVVGGWATYPSEKYASSSVGMMKFPTEWKNKNVPNHQPAGIV